MQQSAVIAVWSSSNAYYHGYSSGIYSYLLQKKVSVVVVAGK